MKIKCLIYVRRFYDINCVHVGFSISSLWWDAQIGPFSWYIQRCMLIWTNCFYFSLCFLDLFIKMRTHDVTCDLFTVIVWNSKLAPFFNLLDAHNHFLPSILCVEKIVQLKLSQRENTFYVNRSHVTWCVLNFDEQIAKQNWDKNNLSISTYTFDFNKLKGAQLWFISTPISIFSIIIILWFFCKSVSCRFFSKVIATAKKTKKLIFIKTKHQEHIEMRVMAASNNRNYLLVDSIFNTLTSVKSHYWQLGNPPSPPPPQNGYFFTFL